MNKPNISILLIARNEEENVKKYLNWLNQCPIINEVIVVDDNSTDDTIKILKSLKPKNCNIKIFSRGLEGNFSAQRQFGISKSTNNLIFWLDPDEEPSAKLIEFLNHIDTNQSVNYAFRRTDVFIGHQLKHGETGSQYFLRLFNKTSGRFVGAVHEVWTSPSPVQNQNLEILHYPHLTLERFLEKINFYTDIRAQELFTSKVQTNLFQIIFYPLVKFIQNYFFRLGFLDGTPGIISALGMSFHSFLVRSKLWCLQNP
jgi:glycosyltransferase involved in cell wall biosynthesis